MRIHLHVTQVPVAELVDLARQAEQLGFHGISLADHIAAPRDIATPYPYDHGRAPWRTAPHWGDPWVVAGAVGSRTSRLRIMSAVYVPELRHPLAVAKQVGTAAVLSGGRVAMGVGAGWLREEFDLLGRPFAGRGARLEEAVAVCRLAWSGEEAEFHGRHYELPPFTMRPAPPHRIPVLFGGAGEHALRRAAELGDGWIAPAQPASGLAGTVADLDRRRTAAGRADHPFEIVAWAGHCRTAEDLRPLAADGATDVRVRPWDHYPDLDTTTARGRSAALTRCATDLDLPSRSPEA